MEDFVFPWVTRSPDGATEVYKGMYLRDYFAAQIAPVVVKYEIKQGTAQDVVAAEIYSFADAMMAARDAR